MALQRHLAKAPIVEAVIDIRAKFADSSSENWDGYGARPIEPVTFLRAQFFLEILPPRWPAPEISAEPDGAIAFEWYWGPRRVLSVSVGKRAVLSYAALFGTGKSCGVEPFTDRLPKFIADLFRRLNSEQG